jgi:hypothetical protein
VGDVVETFTVNIVLEDPCKNPTITLPAETTQVYVITDSEGRYSLEPQFAVDPDFCPYEITISVNGEEIEVEFDPDTQELVVTENTDDLSPANPLDDGSTEKEYPVDTTITVTADDGTTTTETVTTTVTVEDPCVKSDYVELILQASLPNLQYIIDSGAVSYDPINQILIQT